MLFSWYKKQYWCVGRHRTTGFVNVTACKLFSKNTLTVYHLAYNSRYIVILYRHTSSDWNIVVHNLWLINRLWARSCLSFILLLFVIFSRSPTSTSGQPIQVFSVITWRWFFMSNCCLRCQINTVRRQQTGSGCEDPSTCTWFRWPTVFLIDFLSRHDSGTRSHETMEKYEKPRRKLMGFTWTIVFSLKFSRTWMLL